MANFKVRRRQNTANTHYTQFLVVSVKDTVSNAPYRTPWMSKVPSSPSNLSNRRCLMEAAPPNLIAKTWGKKLHHSSMFMFIDCCVFVTFILYIYTINKMICQIELVISGSSADLIWCDQLKYPGAGYNRQPVITGCLPGKIASLQLRIGAQITQ